MVFRPKYYPYPILANFSQDYRTAVFTPALNCVLSDDGRELVFDVPIQQLPPTIENLIIEGAARLALDVDCSSTLYRRVLNAENSKVTVPVESVLGRVSVTPLVLATTEIDFAPSTSDEVDSVFEGAGPFKLHAGDPLTIGDTIHFAVDHSGKKSNSLIQLVPSSDRTSNTFEIFTGQDALQIMVSNEAHTAYQRMYHDSSSRPAFMLGVVKDAILVGIYSLFQGDTEVENYDWAKSIVEKLDDDPEFTDFIRSRNTGADFDLSKAHRAAQKIVASQGIDVLVAQDD